MTINIEALIRCLGQTYHEMLEQNIISYKTKPSGEYGDPDLNLDMVKEGVFLSFKRDGMILQEITLRIQRDGIKGWIFPNDLPTPLKTEMPRQWVHDTFGKPDKAAPPRKVANKTFGWTERYAIEDFHMPIAMQVSYDLEEMVKKITFLPTSALRW
ncbi:MULTISPECIES: DUF6392 family protein [Tenebrionibacter/Tenebrionicola group]|jgi:hypothetical protein|uniref:Pyocin immunity protein n=2 Tax=Tenebrionibacter/Tenebrionicola group TaxID=2969848 RepID=A0A8K0V3S9_9ENTR|nr:MULTISPECIES: DUF6392 family protein [Tenebrionibacter/Tenebrionicola group]MBK4714883.1 pyocin immunity protein [Tenebrionibacter intestinalis]MBV5095709.1 pyocin immunity protein [Tenebrionicola larvae]